MPLSTHLEAFMAKLRGTRRAARYVYQVERYLQRLFEECSWSLFKDVTRESFEHWRARQHLKPKTLNEYHSAASAFFSWMLKGGLIPHHPLVSVEKAKVRGNDKRERRAFSLSELSKLVQVSGDRGIVYLTAAYTGLRRNELRNLEWRDVHLDGETPHIRARASTTKNGKQASIPLHADVVAGLKMLRARELEGQSVFPRLIPEMELFKKHLSLASIPYQDDRGRVADFHSLRNTYATILTLSGAPQREVMELMRHSDMRLTAKVYTDAGQLPLAKTVNALPSLLSPVQTTEQTLGLQRSGVSQAVQVDETSEALESPQNQGLQHIGPNLSHSGQSAKYCTRQESNLNLRLRRPPLYPFNYGCVCLGKRAMGAITWAVRQVLSKGEDRGF